jgi:lambda family phage portal protein
MSTSLPMRVRQAWNALTGASPTAFDAAGRGGSRTIAWNPPAANFGSLRQPPTVLWRSRDCFRNNSWGRRAIEATVAGAVSTGIKPMLQTQDLGLKQRAQQAFLAWTDQCDFEGRRDFFGFQADVLRTVLVDGEAIVVMTPTGRNAVPLELRLLTTEFLDNSRVIPGRVLDGIEYDDLGHRTALYLFPKHPADFPTFQSVRVPVEFALHVFAPPAAGAPRGVSWLEPALFAMRELQTFMETELTRARVAALSCGFVRTPDGSNPLMDSTGALTLEPGSVTRLNPGEELQWSSPGQPQNFEPYVRVQLRAISSALSMPYEVLAADVSQITFASGRSALISWKRWLEMLQFNVLVFLFCAPVWAMWIKYALLAGVLDGQPEDYAARWIAPPLPMLDARAEVLADVERVRAGFVSRGEVVAESGADVEQLDSEIAEQNRRADAWGLIFDSDARKTTLQGQNSMQGDSNATQP